ncbi:MAG: hypothetical protein GY757_36765 [bacterium]|nr:hypothetical protein [bacterium]
MDRHAAETIFPMRHLAKAKISVPVGHGSMNTFTQNHNIYPGHTLAGITVNYFTANHHVKTGAGIFPTLLIGSTGKKATTKKQEQKNYNKS